MLSLFFKFSFFTSSVESITPKTGGTGGGTLLTILGKKLDKVSKILIDDSECIIKEKTSKRIVCETEPHEGATFTGKPEFYTDSGLAECDEEFSYRKI